MLPDHHVPADARPAEPAIADLPCEPDHRFDAIAGLAARLLDVPTALVSLVDETHQTMPGAVGLGSPWAESRSLPLSRSLCRIVVATDAPLTITDVRDADQLVDVEALTEMGVVAYLGHPLTDATGRTVGSLAAIDNQPRRWGGEDQAMLREIADFCSAELALRTVAIRDALVADRDRIAVELQNGVTSDLLALSMLLGGIRSQTPNDNAAMVDDAIDAVDQILARLRATLGHVADR